MKTAVIAGVTGQDGSYLAEFLLKKGYKVIGFSRRVSVDTTERIKHLLGHKNFRVEEGDVSDSSYLLFILSEPVHEFYLLSAQSHVKTSFSQPITTSNINYIGTLNVLETIRQVSPSTKLYFAATSEMFGSSYDVVDGIKTQNENTEFKPQSPYAIAKLAAFQSVRLYRESYGLHASSGILFNHETCSYSTPLIFKIGDCIDILPIGDIARFYTGVLFDLSQKRYQEGKPSLDIEVWDQNGWTKVTWVSGYYHNKDKKPRIINSRNSLYTATGSHPCIMEDGSEKNTSDLSVGDKVKIIDYPEKLREDVISLEEAEWLGMLVADGNVHKNRPRFTNKDMKLKQRFIDLWNSFSNNPSHTILNSKSGFSGGEIGQVEVFSDDNKEFDIYTSDISPFGHKLKKIPMKILNSSIDCMESFLVGYNSGDGLKKNPCTYKFKNFKTNSQTLASGLLFLISKVTGQKYNITVEESWEHGKQQFYYSLNLLSDSQTSIEKYQIVKKLLNNNIPQRKIYRETGISRTFIRKIKNGYVPEHTHHLKKCNNEIKKIIDIPDYDGWFFDLETSSGTFHAGIGQGVVHNSPRRGKKFVTQKIIDWIKRYNKWREDKISLLFCRDSIKDTVTKTSFDKLRLGNLDAYRDWGHAKDYVKAMWQMLQADTPDDYVVATGEAHTVSEFLNEAFGLAGIKDWDNYVVIDPKFYRPAEVDYLCGDSTKVREKLGWTPDFTFKDLVKDMLCSTE